MAKANEKLLNDNDIENIAHETGKILAQQDKVKVRIPMAAEEKQKLEAQEKAGKDVQWPYTPVQVNGYIYQIQHGKTVEVPQTIAEILEQSGLI